MSLTVNDDCSKETKGMYGVRGNSCHCMPFYITLVVFTYVSF